jgi:putative DNA primase/helicase
MSKGNGPTGTRTARSFFSLLFGLVPPDHFLLVWELAGKRSMWFPVRGLDEAAKYAASRKGDIYFGVALSPQDCGPQKRCEAEHTSGIVGLWADIDIKGAAHKKKRLPETLDQARELACSLGITPTVEVDSGHGLQAYWLFHEPWIFENGDDRKLARQLVEHFQAALRHNAARAKWTLDATQDLARVLRVPGTTNCKVKDEPVPVRLLSADGPRYAPDDIAELLAESANNAADTPRPRPSPSAGCANTVAERARRYAGKMPAAISGSGGHDATWRVAQVLVRGFGLSTEEARPILAEFNARCEPPWGEKELQHKLEQAETKSRLPMGYLLNSNGNGKMPGQGGGGSAPPCPEGGGEATVSPEYHQTDLGNAKRVVAQHGENLRHCFPFKRSFIYDNTRWREDDTAAAVRLVKETQAALYCEVAQQIANLGDVVDNEQRERQRARLLRLLRHALEWEDARRINACLQLAVSEPGIPILPAEMDRDPFLLNVQNGTVDLRTGQLREHRREDLITKLAPVKYDSSARCPLWLKFLNRITDNSPALVTYLQRAVGYALTGDVTEQVLFFLFGAGANGKSTFLSAVKSMLGDYGLQAVPELLMAKNNEAHPTERADLFGRRFVCTIEVEEGKRMAEALMKQLTGGDEMTARKMRQDFFQFEPTWKIFLAANHKPAIRGTDLACWRRIKLVPFTITIPEKERDKSLVTKLKAERSGILAWAVQGCLEWQREGLGEPEEVRNATDQYRAEQDAVQGFLNEFCVVNPHFKVRLSELLDRFQKWSGDASMTQPDFRKRLCDKGFECKPGAQGYSFAHGIGLR